MRRHKPEDGDDELPALVEVEMGVSDRALLREALRLTGIERPTEVFRVALAELVERRRFQSWVEKAGVTEP